MRRADCLAGVNGGYFDEKFAPLGLRVLDGKTTSPLKRGRLMSGVVVSNGAIELLRVKEFTLHRKINAALECGPFLVDGNKPVRGLDDTRAARRTFAAVVAENRFAVGVIGYLTLAETARLLAARPGDLKIERALNLDGGSSSAFYCRRAGGDDIYLSNDKPVRDFIGVIAR